MTPKEANYTIGLLCDCVWPDEVIVDVSIDSSRPSWAVVLSLKVPGRQPDIYEFRELLRPERLVDLLAHAREMGRERDTEVRPSLAKRVWDQAIAEMRGRQPAASGGGNTRKPRTALGDDDIEPEPAWLRITRSRIAACTDAPIHCRTMLAGVAAALEFEDIPIPEVFCHRGLSLIMRWTVGVQRSEVAVTLIGALVVRTYCSGAIPYQEAFVLDQKGPGRHWAIQAVRNSVGVVLGKRPVTQQEMETFG